MSMAKNSPNERSSYSDADVAGKSSERNANTEWIERVSKRLDSLPAVAYKRRKPRYALTRRNRVNAVQSRWDSRN